MSKLNIIILFLLLIGCSSRYVYLESRADIDGWERKKFGIYSAELGLQFSVSNSTLVASKDSFLGVDFENRSNFPDGVSQKLIINVVAESYVDDIFISTRPMLIINEKKFQPEAVFSGNHINTFPCEMNEPLIDSASVLIPRKSENRFCVVYIYNIGFIKHQDFFDFIFEQDFNGNSRSILVKFTPQKREEIVTH